MCESHGTTLCDVGEHDNLRLAVPFDPNGTDDSLGFALLIKARRLQDLGATHGILEDNSISVDIVTTELAPLSGQRTKRRILILARVG